MSKGNDNLAIESRGVASGAHLMDALRSERALSVLTRITQAFSCGASSLDHLLEVVVRELPQTDDSACAVLQLVEDGSHYTMRHVYAKDADLVRGFRTWFPEDSVRPVATSRALQHIVETRNSVLLPSLTPKDGEPGQLAAAVTEIARLFQVSSLLMVPLVVGTRVEGAIVLVRYGAEAAPLDEHDLSLARSVAAHAALALTAVELLQRSAQELSERQSMAARLRLLAETSQEFAEATGDYDRLFQVLARRLAEVIGDLCSVRAVSEDGQRLEQAAVHHADPLVSAWVAELRREPESVGEGVAGIVASTGEPILIKSLTLAHLAHAKPHYRQILERLQIGSALSVPLKLREKVVGVVSLVRSGTANPYTEEDLRLVQSIAERAALAIGHARSYQAERAARAEALAANEALSESEVAHRLLFESSPVPVMAFSVDTLQILAANGAVERLYGYTQEELLDLTIAQLRPDAADETEIRGNLARVGDAELAGTVRHQRKDGSLFFAEYHSHCLTLRGQRARITVLTDITARHEAEQTRSLLGAIVRSSNDAIVSQNLDGSISSWNDAAARLFGYSSAEAVGCSIELLISEELRAENTKLLQGIAEGQSITHYETVRRHKNGDPIQVSLSLAPIFDTVGGVIGVSKTVRDLRAQLAVAATLRKTEEQFRQAQKMEAVGRLAGGIAHDFNNTLSVILSYSELVLEDLPPRSSVRGDVTEIRNAAVRAGDLTRQLLLFSRQQVVAPRVLDMNHLITGMENMLQRILGEDIELALVCPEELGQVLADPSHLDQVLMNLVVNARDAMPNGGKLTIETSNIELDGAYQVTHLGHRVQPGCYVMLAVTDTGCGMDQATQARMFEPFFTTKETGKGTGLGLSTVFGIVEQAGGHVLVYSEVGRGTTFKIYLPRTDGPTEAVEGSLERLSRGGKETIVLVEDQDDVRSVAYAILRRSGYNVLVARTPAEALVLCDEHPGKIDLLLTDVVMPQLSGVELAQRVAEKHPSTKVLFMSGYTDDSVVRHGVLQREMAFLQKPFTTESLRARVRGLFDGGTAAP